MKNKMILLNIIIIAVFLILLIPNFIYSNSELVYIDKNNIDTKYHRLTCNHIFPNGYISIIVEDAFNQGYRRCPDCDPPMSDVEKNEREEDFREIFNSSSSFSTTSTSSDTRIVYITQNGSKYHSYRL